MLYPTLSFHTHRTWASSALSVTRNRGDCVWLGVSHFQCISFNCSAIFHAHALSMKRTDRTSMAVRYPLTANAMNKYNFRKSNFAVDNKIVSRVSVADEWKDDVQCGWWQRTMIRQCFGSTRQRQVALNVRRWIDLDEVHSKYMRSMRFQCTWCTHDLWTYDYQFPLSSSYHWPSCHRVGVIVGRLKANCRTLWRMLPGPWMSFFFHSIFIPFYCPMYVVPRTKNTLSYLFNDISRWDELRRTETTVCDCMSAVRMLIRHTGHTTATENERTQYDFFPIYFSSHR